MYYLFVSLVLGAVIGGSALMNEQSSHNHHVQSDFTNSTYATNTQSPIVDNQALSAELAVTTQ